LQPDYDDIEEEENRLVGSMKQFTSSRGKDKVKDNNKKYGKYLHMLISPYVLFNTTMSLLAQI
jgi:hypothetical protein